MNRPEEVHRNFNKPDEEVLQQSDLKLAAFVENKTVFVERFPQLADPFATEWGAATTTARSIAPDYASLANQTSETDALKTLSIRAPTSTKHFYYTLGSLSRTTQQFCDYLVSNITKWHATVSLSYPFCFVWLSTKLQSLNTKRR